MKKAFRYGSWGLGILLGICWSPPSAAQGVIGAALPSDTINYDNSLAATFRSGETNAVPLLRLYWFSDLDGHTPAYYRVHWFNLDQSGRASTGVSSISNGAVSYTLNKSNLLAVLEALGKLPEPHKKTLPYERQIIVSGIRSNDWFRAIYDRAAIPKEIKDVFTRTQANLEDYIH